MRARKKLKPGQNGTKSLVDKYGEQLVCVRYRYDVARNLRYKTVELIIETIPWKPKTEALPDDTIVGLKIGLQEIELQTVVRRLGGKWNRERQVLELRYDKALALGLQSRIEAPKRSNRGKERAA